MVDSLVKRDLQHLWHPGSQMKDYELFPPLEIVKARGSYFELKNGKKMIDAISSWWCKSLGHNHPRLKTALKQQLKRFEHVILANTTHDIIVELSERLVALTPNLKKVFYASDGSSAVEIAMKMSLHSRQITGEQNKQHFLALQNGYHGETFGAMSVSDIGIYRTPYQSKLFDADFIPSLPYVSGTDDPLWQDCTVNWLQIKNFINKYKDTTTAIIVEPIVQGAAGMQVISQDFFKRLRRWSLKHNIHLIADEIMTGFGRTGKMLASEHAHIQPDFICLGKGLTPGWLPLSCILTTQGMYDIFYNDYSSGNNFLHSHTHSGNALAVSVALEVLKIYEEESICDQAEQLGKRMRKAMQQIVIQSDKLHSLRGIGGIVAADIKTANATHRLGYQVYQNAVELGALLRPIGNTIYWLPPLNISQATLTQLQDITAQALRIVKS